MFGDTENIGWKDSTELWQEDNGNHQDDWDLRLITLCIFQQECYSFVYSGLFGGLVGWLVWFSPCCMFNPGPPMLGKHSTTELHFQFTCRGNLQERLHDKTVLFLLLSWLLWDGTLLCNPGWHHTYNDLVTFAYQKQGLQACATTLDWNCDLKKNQDIAGWWWCMPLTPTLGRQR